MCYIPVIPNLSFAAFARGGLKERGKSTTIINSDEARTYGVLVAVEYGSDACSISQGV